MNAEPKQLAKDEIIPKTGRGQYPLLGTVSGYIHYLQLLRLNIDPNPLLDEDLDPVQEKAHLTYQKGILST